MSDYTGATPIPALVEEVLELDQSDENVRRKRNRAAMVNRRDDYVPAVIPLLNRSYVAHAAGINLRRILHDPELYVRFELISKILNFKRFDGDAPLVPDLLVYLGVAFEPEL
jgi:hypothetical protein